MSNKNKGVKGKTNNPNGRPKGTPNRVTADARRAIAQFVDDNAHRLTGWLDQVADEDPAKAFALFQSVIEYHVPKLQRSEHQTLYENGLPTDNSITIKFE